MAFFGVGAFGAMGILAWKGPAVRKLTHASFKKRSEDGVRIQ